LVLHRSNLPASRPRLRPRFPKLRNPDRRRDGPDLDALNAHARGTIRAEDVSVQSIKDKGLDPENGKLRRDFTRRILVSLHDQKN
jgi:hypothetical protein